MSTVAFSQGRFGSGHKISQLKDGLGQVYCQKVLINMKFMCEFKKPINS